ncbi:MAG: DUF3352 domain-containing protein [Deltaproteobacteria bacterium]|nr:DUF3352 domain-containing protein [Deltaproteobacteria bacterium]
MQLINSRKRNFLGIILLLTSLVSCGKGCLSDKEKSPHVLDFMPESTELIMNVNIDKVMQNPLGQIFQKEAPEAWKKWAAHFSYLSIAFEKDKNTGDPEPTVVAIKTKEAPSTVLQSTKEFAKAIGEDFDLQEEKYSDITLYVEKSELDQSDPPAFAFLGDHLVIADKSILKKAIDTLHEKLPSASKNQKLVNALKNVDTKKDIWALALISEESLQDLKKRSGNPMFDVPDLKAFSIELDYPQDLNLSLGIWAQDAAAAQSFTKQLNAALDLFGPQAKKEFPQSQKTIESLKIIAQEDRVTLSASFDKELMEEAKQGLEKAMQEAFKKFEDKIKQ